ncbi:MAG: hypothetical protein JWR21_4223 [Herminiimonas sp.]|nr:hypothetical protein [Herminiimonas sp.]
MKTTVQKISLLTFASIAVLLAGCGGGGSSGASAGGTGTLGVAMTDAPSCGYDAVNVTVNKVRVHQSSSASDTDSGWTDITLNPARKINLLNLTNGVLEDLGQTPLAAGHYTQLRLVLDANTGAGTANSVIVSGTNNEVGLTTPSAVQSGIKLVNEFDVVAGQRADLVLDFDACKSIVKRGNGVYALKPVVTVIPTVLNGIRGFVDPALLGTHVNVTAQQNGTIIRSTTPNATTGEFFLARLAPASYDVVITADTSATTVVAAVPVADTTSTVAISTATAPVALQTGGTTRSISGTVTLTPASATEVGTVAAKQSFSAGPTVTVKYQGADASTGAYTLASLPTTAPLLGKYSATLPIAFAAQTVTTPGTGKYALAATANGYTSQANASVDLTTASQTGVNFSLIP